MSYLHNFPSGKYIIGDPAIYLPGSVYHGIWGDVYQYIPGMYTAFGYPFVIYQTYQGEKEHYDNIGRKYKIYSEMIGVFPIEICMEEKISDLEDNIFMCVLNEMIVYVNKKFLNIKMDGNIHIYIDIGEESFSDKSSDRGSESSFNKFLEEYQKESINKEFETFEHPEEEFEYRDIDNDLDMENLAEMNQNFHKNMKNDNNDNESFNDSHSKNDESEDDSHSKNDESYNKKNKPVFSFFKKR